VTKRKIIYFTEKLIMNKILFLSIALFGLISCTGAQTTQKKTTTKKQQTAVINKVVGQEEFEKMIKKPGAQLIDVRTKDEYNAGHIGDAKNIDFYQGDFKNNMSKLDKSKPVLVYCAAGGRSGQTATMLKEMGFREVYDLSGGYGKWKK
jgi:rhodanese-related sulfurtransferase